MAEDGEIDIEGDFDFKLEANSDVYDTNELPSKSANLLPEYTNPAWMLEQGWTMDNYIDEKSKATIEKMLQEEQYYMNGQNRRRNMRKFSSTTHKQPWSEEEKNLFFKGLEIYGRSWSKIADLIPSRTNLQVKNFAQQYFKQQTKTSGNPESNEEKLQVESDTPAVTIEQVLIAVTTAQPTISVPSKSSDNTLYHSTDTKPVTENVKKTIPYTDLMANKSDAVSLVENNNVQIKTRKENKIKKIKKSTTEVTRVNKKSMDNDKGISSEIKISKESTMHKPAPLVKIKNIKVISLHGNATSSKDGIGLNDVLEVVTIPTVQLSPTLEHKLEKSTGLIENLDGFCAVADIVSGSGKGEDEEEDIDIDIENDDEMEDNVILKNRSTSPNSVYESLLKSAEVKARSTKASMISTNIEDLPVPDSLSNGGKEDIGDDNYKDRMDSEMSACSESSDDGLSESGNHSDSSQYVEKRVANMVVLSNGETVEFPIPTEEKVPEDDVISDEEKRVHLEFFDGRPSKTPDRYLKIRNYILESWRKCAPNYLNKTSVRPGLKNCGDVNCIGRIHTYLECIGAINYGCEQCCYNHPVKVAITGGKERSSRDVIIKGFKLNSMRPRKRKIKDAYGNWIDINDLQGRTIDHQDQKNEGKLSKNVQDGAEKKNNVKTYYDPFKLIPCESFTNEQNAPFSVEIYNSCLLIMDVHAHVSKTEVIGMLGGQYSDGRLSITMSIPCNSISTGMQCEMDPVSQTQASEEIEKYGMSVVGWYHSHPTFEPNPSIRDMETQLKFQEWFSKGGSRFVGIIVSPYSRFNTSLSSQIRCLTISDEIDYIQMCNKPYKFEYDIIQHDMDMEAMLSVIHQLAEKYSLYHNRVEMLGSYRSFTGHTCLSKMLVSVNELMFNQVSSTEFLKTVEDFFTQMFSMKGEDQTEEMNDGDSMLLKEDVPSTSLDEHCSEQIVDEHCSEQIVDEHCSEQIVDERCSEQTVDEHCSEQTADEYCSEQTADQQLDCCDDSNKAINQDIDEHDS